MIAFIAHTIIVYLVAEVAAVIGYLILEPEAIIPGYNSNKEEA